MNFARHLESGDLFLEESDDGFFGQSGTVELSDVDAADLAHPVIGNADYSRFVDAGQASQHSFDLGGVDVESAADVHVLETVGDVEISTLVEGSDITGVQPTVGVDGLGGGLRIVEVSEHDIRSA